MEGLMAAKQPQIDCRFGEAKVDDLLPLPSPFKFGEIIGKLVKVRDNGRFLIHTYDLYVFGAWIGRAEAKQDGPAVDWRAID
jgi:hypothetical protein